jgi:four helix bundle protein
MPARGGTLSWQLAGESKTQHFRNLKVWQRSHALALDLYRITTSFPKDERFGLVSQLRRAAASVPTNIAEDAKRQGRKDYARFLNIAEGSLAEIEYLVLLSRDLNYIPSESAEVAIAEVGEIGRMLHGLRTRVESHGTRVPIRSN